MLPESIRSTGIKRCLAHLCFLVIMCSKCHFGVFKSCRGGFRYMYMYEWMLNVSCSRWTDYLTVQSYTSQTTFEYNNEYSNIDTSFSACCLSCSFSICAARLWAIFSSIILFCRSLFSVRLFKNGKISFKYIYIGFFSVFHFNIYLMTPD